MNFKYFYVLLSWNTQEADIFIIIKFCKIFLNCIYFYELRACSWIFIAHTDNL